MERLRLSAALTVVPIVLVLLLLALLLIPSDIRGQEPSGDHSYEFSLLPYTRGSTASMDAELPNQETLASDAGEPSIDYGPQRQDSAFIDDPILGDRIAYVGVNGDLWRMRSDGEEKRQLTSGLSGVYGVVWSHLTGQIAFVAGDIRDTGTRAIYVINADGSDLRRVSGGFSQVYDRPAWSPNDRYLAYISASSGDTGGVLHVYHLETGSETTFTVTNPSLIRDLGDGPTWSPDGEWIAFSGQKPNGKWGIYRNRPDGTELQFLGGDYMEGESGCGGARIRAKLPAWSPDGARIAFIGARCECKGLFCFEYRAIWSLFLISASGGAPWRVADVSTSDNPARQATIGSPLTWSPDGRRLAIPARRGDARFYIVTYNAATRRLDVYGNASGQSATGVSWSPDGRQLVAGFVQNQVGTVYRLEGDTGTVSALAQGGGPDWGLLVANVDLQITAIEVTQGIQCLDNPNCFGESHRDWCPTEDCDNAVPLLLNKPTWARVYVKSNIENDAGVTGLLKGFYADGTDLPHSPLLFSPGGIVAHTNGGDRGNPNDTLNFRLPIEWTRQDRITLEARIYPTGSGQSTSSDTKRIDVTFTERNPLLVYWWRFKFPVGQVATREEARATTAFMAKTYPLISDTLEFRYRGDELDIRDRGELPVQGTTWQLLVRELANSCGDLRRNLHNPRAKCYGWVPRGVNITSDDGETYYGWTDFGVSVGYIYLAPLTDGQQNLAPQYIIAHEIGHTLPPVAHVATANCGGTADGDFERQFPNNTGGIDEYGFWGNESVQWVYSPEEPNRYYDFMSYCGVDDNHQWVSPYIYKHLHDAIGAPDLVWTESATAASTQEYLIASGVVAPDDSVTVYPFYREVYPTGTDDLPGSGPYNIELQDTQGRVLFTRFFDQRAAELPAQGAPVHFFEVLPFPSGTSRILIKRSTTVLREMSPSPNVPQVTVLAPSSGQTVDGMMEIRWTGSDADGELLHYMVEYSADRGNTWRTIGVDLTDTTLVVKADDLPGTTQGKIRVLATDGINTGVGESGLFTVTRKPPKVYILSPQDGVVIAPGQWLHLSGLAEDREDGLLSETTLVWTLDGVTRIGVGRQLTLFNPSPGIHDITLTAMDTDGNEGTATVSIFVGHRTYLPFAAKGYRGE